MLVLGLSRAKSLDIVSSVLCLYVSENERRLQGG